MTAPDPAELQRLGARINAITAMYRIDPEAAHADEDTLLRDLITQYCPEPVRDAIDRLYRADVQRWYA